MPDTFTPAHRERLEIIAKSPGLVECFTARGRREHRADLASVLAELDRRGAETERLRAAIKEALDMFERRPDMLRLVGLAEAKVLGALATAMTMLPPQPGAST
jgi:hypothetical protein